MLKDCYFLRALRRVPPGYQPGLQLTRAAFLGVTDLCGSLDSAAQSAIEPTMEPADAPRPKMKLKIQKVAAKLSTSSSAPTTVTLSSTDPELEERTVGVLRGNIEIHETHCSNRGVRQANGRCCEEMTADAILILVRKPFNDDPLALKFATASGAAELGFVPAPLSRLLSPLIDSNQFPTGLKCSVDGKSATTAPSFVMVVKVAPASVRRGAVGSNADYWKALARILGFASVDDMIKTK